MPDGEDPDTLVRKGGAAALEPILRDAVDVLDRKIQLLERKGWFEGLEHRRDALDRLLPTIRAAHDPITRELYLSRVAERTGIDKKILEQEAAEKTDGRAGGQAGNTEPVELRTAPWTDSGRSARSPVREVTPPRREGAKAEFQLLAVGLTDASWMARAREAVPPEWFEVPELREVFEQLRNRPDADAAALAEALTPGGQRAWTALQERALSLAGQRLDSEFTAACQLLESRPLFRELDGLTERLRLAPAGEQAALADEKQRRTEELKSRYPEVWARQSGWRRLRGARADGRQRT
jgi:DNA primase